MKKEKRSFKNRNVPKLEFGNETLCLAGSGGCQAA